MVHRQCHHPRTVTFGQTGDIPEPGNYDGLGYDQIAVYRPSTGQFLVLEPNGTTETLNLGVGSSADLSSLVPVPGAYDNLAYFRAIRRRGLKRLYTIPSPASSQSWGPATAHTRSPGSSQEIFRPPLIIWGTGQPSPLCSDPAPDSSLGQGGRSLRHSASRVIYPWRLLCHIACPAVTLPRRGLGQREQERLELGQRELERLELGQREQERLELGQREQERLELGQAPSTSSPGSTSPPPTQSPGSGLTHPGTSSHKKKVAKHKPKPVAHHKKPVVHKKVKVVQHHASKPVVHVVEHKATKVVTHSALSASKAKSSTHLVDLALEDIHANLRRSSVTKKHQG